MSMPSRDRVARLLLAALVATLGVWATPAFSKKPNEPASSPAAGEATSVAQKFARPDQTLEYHFMLKTPPFTEENRDQALGPLLDAMKSIGEIGKLKGPREGAYIDTKDRMLEGRNLILRLRPNLITIKARGTSMDTLIDLKPCVSNKYEQDYFEEIGYSISAEHPLK